MTYCDAVDTKAYENRLKAGEKDLEVLEPCTTETVGWETYIELDAPVTCETCKAWLVEQGKRTYGGIASSSSSSSSKKHFKSNKDSKSKSKSKSKRSKDSKTPCKDDKGTDDAPKDDGKKLAALNAKFRNARVDKMRKIAAVARAANPAMRFGMAASIMMKGGGIGGMGRDAGGGGARR